VCMYVCRPVARAEVRVRMYVAQKYACCAVARAEVCTYTHIHTYTHALAPSK
jgi:hypothetical protein